MTHSISQQVNKDNITTVNFKDDYEMDIEESLG